MAKTILIKIAKVVAFIALFILIDRTVAYFIEPVYYIDYLNHDMDIIDETGENVDMLLMGASHVQFGLIPSVFEEQLGIGRVLNFAAPEQEPKGIYYSLKSLIPKYRPKYVVVDVSNQTLYDEYLLEGKLGNIDRMGPLQKLEYIISDEQLIKNLPMQIKSFRFKDSLFDEDDVKKTEVAKGGYTDVERDGWSYTRGGHISTGDHYEDGMIPLWGYAKEEDNVMLPESLEYYEKISELCRKNDVSLYLVSCPISVSAIYETSDYEMRVNQFSDWAREHGVKYHNLSMLINRELFLPDHFMRDSSHLNSEGAAIISQMYAAIISMEESGVDTSPYFYDALNSFKSSVSRVPGVTFFYDKDGNTINGNIHSVHNDWDTILYRVSLRGDGNDGIVVKDWSEDHELSVDFDDYPKGYNKLWIEACVEGSGEPTAFYEKQVIGD